MKPRLTYPAWDNLMVPAIAINPAGTPTPASIDTDDGTLLFATGNTAACQFQMPHAWKVGTNIKLHIHWCKTTSAAGTVKWRVKYEWTNIGGTISAFSAFTDLTEVAAAPNSDTAGKHALAEHPEISGSGKTMSSVIRVVIERNATGDTYGANAKLLGIDIHYQIDSFGSHLEYIKL